MTRKQHTIIVVPHARARFRQFQVSSRLLWSVAAGVCLSLLLGVVFGVLWIGSVRRNREVSSLQAENQDLRGRTKALNTRLESLEKLLAGFEERTRRLSIVAGLSGVHDPGTGGVGGLTALPVEGPGHTEAALEEASRRGLAIVAGTQRRHDPRYVETIRRLHDGAIGDIVTGQVYWNQGGLWSHQRKPEWSDAEFQLRNWLYYTWASGDHIVEQHVHNLDVANWVLGAHPVRALGAGGRQTRTDPLYGQIFDHFAVEYEYPDGQRIFSMCRQQDGTASRVGERFQGTRGMSNAYDTIEGATSWKHEKVQVDPYVEEHRDLVASIRAGTPLNEGRRIAESTLTAILGREACYTGQVVSWDELVGSAMSIVPTPFALGPLEVPPVPTPGETRLDRGVIEGW